MELDSPEQLCVEVGVVIEDEAGEDQPSVRLELYVRHTNRVRLGRSLSSSSVPAEFLCPISQRIMQEPVVLLPSGQTYERRCIQAWLLKSKNRATCPMTGATVTNKSVVVNWALKHAIQHWQQHQQASMSRSGSQLLLPFGAASAVTLRLLDNRPSNPQVLYGQWLTHLQDGVWHMVEVLQFRRDKPVAAWQLRYSSGRPGASDLAWADLCDFKDGGCCLRTLDGSFAAEWLSCEVAVEHSSAQDDEDSEEEDCEEELEQAAEEEAESRADAASSDQGISTPRRPQFRSFNGDGDGNALTAGLYDTPMRAQAQEAAARTLADLPSLVLGMSSGALLEASLGDDPARSSGGEPSTSTSMDGGAVFTPRVSGAGAAGGALTGTPGSAVSDSPASSSGAGSTRSKAKARRKILLHQSSDGVMLDPDLLVGAQFKARLGQDGQDLPCLFRVLEHCSRWGESRWKLHADDASLAGWYSLSEDLRFLHPVRHPELEFRDNPRSERELCIEWLREQLQQLRDIDSGLDEEPGQGVVERMKSVLEQLSEKLRQLRQDAGRLEQDVPVRWIGVEPVVEEAQEEQPRELPRWELLRLRQWGGMLLNSSMLIGQQLWVGASSEPLTVIGKLESDAYHNISWTLEAPDGRLHAGCFNSDFTRFRNDRAEAGRVEWAGIALDVVAHGPELPQVELKLAADGTTVLNASDLLGHQLECVWPHKCWQQGIVTRVVPAGRSPNRWGVCFENGDFKWGSFLEHGGFRMGDTTTAAITWLTCNVTWSSTQLQGPLPAKKPVVVVERQTRLVGPAHVTDPSPLIGQPLMIGTSGIRADVVQYKASNSRYRWLVRYDGGDQDWGDFDDDFANFITIYRKRCVREWLACEPQWQEAPETLTSWATWCQPLITNAWVLPLVAAGVYIVAKGAMARQH